MSATLLYHMHGIRGDALLRQNIVSDGVEFFLAPAATPTRLSLLQIDESSGKKEQNNDDSDHCPAEGKQPPSAAVHGKTFLTPRKVNTAAGGNNRFPRLRWVWADGGYAGKLIDYVYYWYLLVLQIVRRSDDQKDFVLLLRRWVVEWMFGWLMNYRRLCWNDEYWTETSETVVKVTMIPIMLRRRA